MHTLRAQVGHSEMEKGKIVEDLKTITRKMSSLKINGRVCPYSMFLLSQI
jgi:hypothetical protein